MYIVSFIKAKKKQKTHFFFSQNLINVSMKFKS